ncbi:cache domain-containing protein [Thiomicrorhabdus sediminis]|uniref:Diguanylate cyclase n=1 Tax=Thiomicrorhabdus sediminis TaxID=2580412 RepID=A0A4V1HHP4_9GAMM|nr:cache domain-containing protein [Thiomicrorhabdus sediminis]QCU89733.1 diguanylate cyclase [Thiomicrorhabdus sediminis]
MTKEIMQKSWTLLPLSLMLLLPLMVIVTMSLAMNSNERVYQNMLAQINENFVDAEKERIRSDVNRAVDIIINRQIELQNQLRQRLKIKADNVHDLLAEMSAILPEQTKLEQEKHLINLLRTVKKSADNDEVWLISRNGKLLLAPDYYFNLEGELITGFTDTLGKHYIEEELQFLQRNTQGFLSSRTKKELNGITHDDTRLSYIKRLPFADWYVAVRSNLKSALNNEYSNLLQIFHQASVNSPDYFFIFDSNGNVLMNSVRNDLVGKNLFKVNEYKAQEIFNLLLEASRSPKDEFIEYRWPNSFSGQAERKISFVQPVPNLDWIVGKGFYPESLTSQFEMQKKRLQHEYQVQTDFFISISWLGGFLAFVLGLLIAYFLERSRRSCLIEQQGENGELKKQNIMLENQLLVKDEALKRLQLDLLNHSIIDPQTQIASRSILFMRLRDEAQRCSRFQQGFAVCLFSIDEFFALQSQYPEHVIDSLLQEMTTVVFNQTRAIDLLGRFDEGHFMIIMPSTDSRELEYFIKRLQQSILDKVFVDDIQISISCGAAEFLADQPVSEFINQLEKALQKAKQKGESCYHINV